MDVHAGLDARLLVGAEDVLILAQRLSVHSHWYRSRTRPAVRAKRWSRGKIHDRRCPGLIVSSARQRTHTSR
jgi:hypothetical protein